MERDFADKSTVIGASASLGFDTVGQVNEPLFEEHLRTIGARVSGTQLIDRYSFVTLEYELGHARGYQSSPYRFVGIGTKDGTCQLPQDIVLYCARETNPELRVRHATPSRAASSSTRYTVGAEYRFYLDSGDVQSHTMGADVICCRLAAASALRYRLHPGAAEHYRPIREERDDGIYTRDKEMSR